MTCPASLVVKEGQPWPEGEASIRAVMDRVKGFRRCVPSGPEPAEARLAVAVLEADAAGAGAALQQGDLPAASASAGAAEQVLVVRESGDQCVCRPGGGACG